ncbi:hypothetical protein SDC9_174563 [bioreactor metagenome]|uniref:Uncharacterized protein n=1 Tax=bioreactor metagenome TaxID=1076179 RepID=A0A645GLP4_9ZZZZ
MFTAADDGIVRDVMHILVHGLGDGVFLDAYTGDQWGDAGRSFYHDDLGAVTGGDGMDISDFQVAQGVAFGIQHGDDVLIGDHFMRKLKRDGNQRKFRVGTVIYQGDGQSGATGNAALTHLARVIVANKDRDGAKVFFVDHDQPVGA